MPALWQLEQRFLVASPQTSQGCGMKSWGMMGSNQQVSTKQQGSTSESRNGKKAKGA